MRYLNLARSIFVGTVLLAAGCLVRPAQVDAQSLASCRTALLRGNNLAIGAMLKEIGKCHQGRLLGRVAAAVDCNDAAAPGFPSARRVGQANAKAASLLARRCDSSTGTPHDAGYFACPAPCAAVSLTDQWSSMGNCLACLRSHLVGDAEEALLGAPAVPQAGPERQCQNVLGRGLRDYVADRSRVQARCGSTHDGTPDLAACRTADPDGEIAASAAAVAARLTLRCTDAQLAAPLDSCATTLDAEKDCLIAGGADLTDYFFAAVYQPAPEAAATPTLTPTDTLSPVPSPTNTPTCAPTGTPYYPSQCNCSGGDSSCFNCPESSPGCLAVPCGLCVGCPDPDQVRCQNCQPGCELSNVSGCPCVTPTPTPVVPTQTPTLSPTITRSPTRSPTCAPTGTPHFESHCNCPGGATSCFDCEESSPGCLAIACGECVGCPADEVRCETCAPGCQYDHIQYIQGCPCVTPTPTPPA